MFFNTAPHGLTDFLNTILCLIAIIAGTKHSNTLTVSGTRPEVFTQTVIIVRDQFIGGVENVTERAVILFKLNEVTDLKIPLKIHHIADVGSAESINGLVIVTHGKDTVAVEFPDTGR